MIYDRNASDGFDAVDDEDEIRRDCEYQARIDLELQYHYTMFAVMCWRLGIKMRDDDFRCIWFRREGFAPKIPCHKMTDARIQLHMRVGKRYLNISLKPNDKTFTKQW